MIFVIKDTSRLILLEVCNSLVSWAALRLKLSQSALSVKNLGHATVFSIELVSSSKVLVQSLGAIFVELIVKSVLLNV